MKSSAYAGHRKIVHLGIDSAPTGAPDQNGLLDLLCEYTDLVEFAAADAVFLDVTYNAFDIPFGARVAKMIKGDIKRQLGLGISVGLGPSKFVAKTAMESHRPDGLTVVLPEEVASFLAELPLDRLPGAGEVTRERLVAMGIERVGQLAQSPLDDLVRRFGQRGHDLWLLARGQDEELVAPAQRPSQIGERVAFDAPVYTIEEMRDALRDLAAALGGRLRRRGLRGRLVTLKADYPDSSGATRTMRLSDYTDRAAPLAEAANALLDQTEAARVGVRYLGIGLGGFADEAVEQLDLFP